MCSFQRSKAHVAVLVKSSERAEIRQKLFGETSDDPSQPRSAHIFLSISQPTYITPSIVLGNYPLSRSHVHIFGAKVFPQDGATPLFHKQVRAIGDAVFRGR
jgi:hypothetical protein